MIEKKVKIWTPISYRLPPPKTKVQLKREIENLEWISKGKYSYFNDKVVWSIKKAEGLTLNNSTPTHWKDI